MVDRLEPILFRSREEEKKIMRKLRGSLFLSSILIAVFVEAVIILPSYIFKVGLTNGCSMEPLIHGGELTFIQVGFLDRENLGNGTIIVYDNDNGILVLHRIIEVVYTCDGCVYYWCQGDNNLEKDPSPVFPRQILGVYLFKIPL